MSKMSIFDVSALVYTGNYSNRATQMASERFGGVPVGGIRYALKVIFSSQINSSVLIGAFDSKTDKASLFEGYKGNRSFNNDVFTQLEILKYLLPKLGVHSIREDNYEADDLIYSLVYANEPVYSNVYVYADDSDLAGTIISDKVKKIGTSSKVPLITSSNYSTTVRKGKLIKYNTVLAYYFFRGKESNNLPAVRDGKKYYEMFLNWCDQTNQDYSKASTIGVMQQFLVYAYKNMLIEDSLMRYLLTRVSVVYPRLMQNPNSKLVVDYNERIASEYLSILGLKDICALLGIKYTNPDEIEKSGFLKWRELYNEGVIHINEDKPADKTYWFNSETPAESVGGF